MYIHNITSIFACQAFPGAAPDPTQKSAKNITMGELSLTTEDERMAMMQAVASGLFTVNEAVRCIWSLPTRCSLFWANFAHARLPQPSTRPRGIS